MSELHKHCPSPVVLSEMRCEHEASVFPLADVVFLPSASGRNNEWKMFCGNGVGFYNLPDNMQSGSGWRQVYFFRSPGTFTFILRCETSVPVSCFSRFSKCNHNTCSWSGPLFCTKFMRLLAHWVLIEGVADKGFCCSCCNCEFTTIEQEQTQMKTPPSQYKRKILMFSDHIWPANCLPTINEL